MSSLSGERLYALLPAVYRVRDGQVRGEPLRALIALIARELSALEDDVEQLYDDQFIETCRDWIAPYVGDLIGYRSLHHVAARVASPRTEVANTIAFRRRKGTAAMLEQLARDVTDWPARAVEFFEQLVTTQFMNHVRLHAAATAKLASAERLRALGGPFDTVAHTAEMRRPESGSGRYNIVNVGIFLWTLQPFSVNNVPLTPDAGDPNGRRHRFNPLGADLRLFRRPVTETAISHIAEPANVPDPIDLRTMARAVRAAASDPDVFDDYGRGSSIVLARPAASPSQPPEEIPVGDIRVCDLRDVPGGWAHEGSVPAAQIAIDPNLGRVVLGADVAGPILGTFHYGFSRAIGGGEYERLPTGGALTSQRTARGGETLQPHLDAIAGGGRLIIEDSFTYTATPTFKVEGATAPGEAGIEVVVAAANGARPLIAAGGPVTLDIGARGRLVLEGLVLSGGALRLAAVADHEPRTLVLRDCTLVPGLRLNADGGAAGPGAPSLVLGHPFAVIRIERCIVGALTVDRDADLELADSIVDAGLSENVAIAGPAGGAGGRLSLRDCTVIGKVHGVAINNVSNVLFVARLAADDQWPAPVWIERRQEGCVRFSFVPPGSLVPRRFRCVPDEGSSDVIPHFTSLRYGDPGYAQLQTVTDRAIRNGADDEAEIGVMHSLYRPQREANVRIRLDEYLRFGLRAGVFYVT